MKNEDLLNNYSDALDDIESFWTEAYRPPEHWIIAATLAWEQAEQGGD